MINVLENLLVGLIVAVPTCWFAMQLKYASSKEELISKIKRTSFQVFYWCFVLLLIFVISFEFLHNETISKSCLFRIILYSCSLTLMVALKLFLLLAEKILTIQKNNHDDFIYFQRELFKLTESSSTQLELVNSIKRMVESDSFGKNKRK